MPDKAEWEKLLRGCWNALKLLRDARVDPAAIISALHGDGDNSCPALAGRDPAPRGAGHRELTVRLATAPATANAPQPGDQDPGE
jgi:hypothetical protein